MKQLKYLFEKIDPYFKPGGSMSRFFGIYQATRTFFFLPSPVNRCAPHIRDHLDLKRFMSFVILALLPVTLFGMYNAGYQYYLAASLPEQIGFFKTFTTGALHVVPIIIVSYTVGFFWEILFATIRGHEVTEGLLVTGLLFPLTLPPTIPLWQVAVGMSFGIVIGKEVFGGTGRNLLNPALTARAFIFFSYPASMSGNAVWRVIPEKITEAGASIQNGITGISQAIPIVKNQIDQVLVDALSGATPLSLGGSTGYIEATLHQAGFDLKTLLTGLHPGSIGETSALLCFAGAIFLMVIRIASYRIIIGGIAGVVITSMIFKLLPGPQGTWFSAGPLYHLFSGGFALGISYMATDPVSAPGTDAGRWIYGFLIGFFTVLIRAVNPAYVEGVMLSILFMNVFSPLLDHITIKIAVAKRIPNG
ncbi:Na(+)-translocating NADH-quinone reductase subunit B [Desulfamplus magnetovallimortis]|uniref:Na(+)-translocating NADH-quinone reductase subunit B n=1 Tax=Desulfamplus magnetovallimortis TaxID=1246637 RepID=A0A1W1H6J3_9BACT|nr:NADH:ubiquinone reductase (Na(+)-transporting) subunit B [Desulfamplus magnetovallimortis]SLM28110.1 Na(+)-translocating NADH-quinone reductase subunit B [Desulfamplus magnetovallimortis]